MREDEIIAKLKLKVIELLIWTVLLIAMISFVIVSLYDTYTIQPRELALVEQLRDGPKK